MKQLAFIAIYTLLTYEIGISDEKFASIRHLSDNLYEASPTVEDYQSFRSDLDLNDDWSDLEENFEERAKELQHLEKVQLNSLSLGKRFTVHKKMLDLIENQITYLIFKRNYDFKQTYQRWLIELEEKKPEIYDKRLEVLKLKGLEIARTMAATYKKLEPEFTQFILVKFYILNGNENYTYYLKKFSKKFPKSDMMADMWHLAGEAEFQKKAYQQASKYFQLALAIKESKIRPISAFKLAWCHLLSSTKMKDGEREKSLKKTDTAFRLTLKLAKKQSKNKVNYPIENIVAKDLSWFWAETNIPLQKVTMFAEKNKIPGMVSEYLYYRGIREAHSKQVNIMNQTYAQLYKLSTEDRALPFYFAKGIELNIYLKNYAYLPKIFHMFHAMTKKNSEWHDEFEDDKYLVSYTEQQLAYLLRTSSVDLHQVASSMIANSENLKTKQQREKNISLANQLYASASALYLLFFEWFPNRQEFDDIVFNLGSIYLEQERYNEAIRYFHIVAKRNHKTLSYNAAYNAVIAAYTMVQKSPSPQLPEPGKALKPIVIPNTHQQLISQIDFFIKKFPDAKEANSSQYTAGQVLYDYGHYEASFKRFKELAVKAPESAEGENAMRAILSFYWEKKDWQKVVDIGNQLIIEPTVIEAGHEKFLEETLSYAQSQLSVSKK